MADEMTFAQLLTVAAGHLTQASERYDDWVDGETTAEVVGMRLNEVILAAHGALECLNADERRVRAMQTVLGGLTSEHIPGGES